MASKTLRELTIKLDADIAELKKDLAKAQKQVGGFQKKLNGIGKSFKAAFSIAAIGAASAKLYQFGQEVSDLGKELEGVKAGFAGIDPKVLDDMRRATHGTVTDLELMKNAVQAKNFGLPVEQLGTMLEFVHRRARASGESVDYLTQSLVLGLGRKSKMIIDNLGISTYQLNQELKKTPDFTEAVANIMKRDMQEAGAYVETAADITERWAAEWENSKAKIGLFINKGIKLIAPYVDNLKKQFADLFDSKKIVEFINWWIELYNDSIAFRAIIVGLKLNFKIMWESFKYSINLMIDALKTTGKILKYVFSPKNWGTGFGEGLKKITSESFAEVWDDTKIAGKNIATAYTEGFAEMMEGKKEFVSASMLSDEVKASVNETAKQLGQSAANNFASGMRSGDVPDLMQPLKSGQIKTETPEIDTSQITAAATQIKKVKKSIEVDLSSVNNFIADSISQLAVNIGNGLSGTGNLFSGLLSMVLEFGKAFGKLLISIGVASLGLKKVFANPFAAIAAGMALVALSTVGLNAIKKKNPAFAGGGIVPGTSVAHDRVPVNLNSGEMVLNTGQQRNLFTMLNNGTSPRGGTLTARVSGADLLFVLNEAKRMDSNSY